MPARLRLLWHESRNAVEGSVTEIRRFTSQNWRLASWMEFETAGDSKDWLIKLADLRPSCHSSRFISSSSR